MKQAVKTLSKLRSASQVLLEGLRARVRFWRIAVGRFLLGSDAPVVAPNNLTPSLLQERLRTPGLNCPQCGTLIVVTLQDLLGKGSVVCPNSVCSLRLDVHPERSRETLTALRTHHA